jgi:protein-S-isoprenylcysteine O-methyltransferase Ste14
MNTLKTILYMGSMHGFFTFYLPFRLAMLRSPLFGLDNLRYIALPLWMMGAWIIIRCSMDMVRRGCGTPAHMDPPKRLLLTGLYFHVRNPIYLGALLALSGHIAWSGSGWVIAYFLCYVIAFQILIVFFEEPVLKKVFGKEYEDYCKNVPRWIPRFG